MSTLPLPNHYDFIAAQPAEEAYLIQQHGQSFDTGTKWTSAFSDKARVLLSRQPKPVDLDMCFDGRIATTKAERVSLLHALRTSRGREGVVRCILSGASSHYSKLFEQYVLAEAFDVPVSLRALPRATPLPHGLLIASSSRETAALVVLPAKGNEPTSASDVLSASPNGQSVRELSHMFNSWWQAIDPKRSAAKDELVDCVRRAITARTR